MGNLTAFLTADALHLNYKKKKSMLILFRKLKYLYYGNCTKTIK